MGKGGAAMFETLKHKLISAPILGYPDPIQQIIMSTMPVTWELEGQEHEGKERVIVYYCKTLPPQRAFIVRREEFLATVELSNTPVSMCIAKCSNQGPTMLPHIGYAAEKSPPIRWLCDWRY